MATTSVVFTYPNGKATELLDRFCKTHDYQATFTNPATGEVINNPETQLQFFERKLKEFVANSIRSDKQEEAVEAARIAAIAAINSEIPIT